MRKSKAIKMLSRQLAKLEDKDFIADEKWIIHTQDYIKYFFGDDSPQYDYIKKFTFYISYYVNTPDDKIKAEKERVRNNAKQFIRDCSEIIEFKGIINQNHNFLERINNQTLIPVIITIISGILFIGYLFGISTTDSKNVELRQEIKEMKQYNKILKDSLSISPTSKISDNISK
jgi:hypothetical protein